MEPEETGVASELVTSSASPVDFGSEAQYNLSALTLSDVVRCGYFIRQTAIHSHSMEEVVNGIVKHLFDSCRNPETGENDIALVRFFKTHSFGDLNQTLQESARAMAPDNQLKDNTKCLILLATAGERPEWNDRHQSQGHRVIPLLSESAVSQIPMIAQLVSQFGLDLSAVINPTPDLLVELDQRHYNVFHVKQAVGSPFIPAQDEFVKPFGVRSVLGFGGMLPTGNLFSVIIFSKTDISRAIAEVFRTIALKIKTTILPFEEIAVFQEDDLSNLNQLDSDHMLSLMHSKVAALEELESVYDRMVIEQSGRLEHVVREIESTNHDLQREIENRKLAETEREDLHKQLLKASRQAGMAEMAVGVLHNIGNVLNGINVSAKLVQERTRSSKLPQLRSASDLINKHAEDLAEFITVDERGKHVPKFLSTLADVLENESIQVDEELNSLLSQVDHVNAIVRAQQSFATLSGVSETISIVDAIEDALKMAMPSLTRHGIKVVREFAKIPQVTIDKQKLLQILVNLINNAKDAIMETQGGDQFLTLRTSQSDPNHILVDVEDTGIGIAQENLSKIFAHGFTTKQDRGGHGFGLHHSANAATELGGHLTACSNGKRQGAIFHLQLPLSHE
ncbi:ATP-binding protein [uncultured Gimesia sp.]|uniref:sensor histidine kinase n=1 Tax=uncultured Gimesia sp. TaxID=1678688 RepID=UPI0030DBB10D|tara:strand:+ start:2083 stop:3951 length:1869 start_codon:yes stop_codon:yes gene_type:complete